MCRFLEGVRAAVPLIAGSISWAPISWPREVPRLTELLELVRTSEEDGSCTPSVPCRSDQSETQADRDGYDRDGDAEHEGRSRTSGHSARTRKKPGLVRTDRDRGDARLE